MGVRFVDVVLEWSCRTGKVAVDDTEDRLRVREAGRSTPTTGVMNAAIEGITRGTARGHRTDLRDINAAAIIAADAGTNISVTIRHIFSVGWVKVRLISFNR